MTKKEILKETGIKLRSVKKKDRANARTDYQRDADYIITTSNGEEYFSKNGSLKDCLWAEKNSQKTKKK